MPQRPDDAELPIYSVLIPLHDEAHMVPELTRTLLALDYPPERLDIKFVVEQVSHATVEAAAAVARQYGQFTLVVVPDAAPRTKPKALDYALPLLRGEFVVVFDAEDAPDPDQLWRAARCFADQADVECIQAELVIDNAGETPLTALFAGEYAGLFGVHLPALARWGMPVPLGGTSNHFRVATLRALGGWDAYNVTEDADLGARLARSRLRVQTMRTRTLEEAPVGLSVWMRQRTRWMKGWMQTIIVHNRRPRQLLRQIGWRGFLMFELLAISMIAAPLLHTAFALFLFVRVLAGHPPAGEGATIWHWIYIGIFAFGYGAALLQTIVGLLRIKRSDQLLAQVALPIYWCLMSLATIRALYQLLERPFYWAKTQHRAPRARS